MANANLITYNGSTVTPLFDAMIQELFSPEPKGIIYGCEVSISGPTILHVEGGYGIAYGREFQIPAQNVSVTLPSSGVAAGRIYVKIDLGNTDAPCEVIADRGGDLPADTANFNINNGVAYVSLATCSLNFTEATNLRDTRHTLASTGAVIESLRAALTDRVDDLETSVNALGNFDINPVKNSHKAVTSGGLFNVLSNALQYGISQVTSTQDIIDRAAAVGDFVPFITGANTDVTSTLASAGGSSILLCKGMSTAETPRVMYVCFTMVNDSAVVSNGYVRISDKKAVYERFQKELDFDASPKASSNNPVTSAGIKTALDAKANLASPSFTGTPKAPTAAAGANTTQLATTAFVSRYIQQIDDTERQDYTIPASGYVSVIGPIIGAAVKAKLLNVVPLHWASNSGAFWVMPYLADGAEDNSLRAYIVGTPGTVIKSLSLRYYYIQTA